jgi:DnaJ homolog subfamily C member 28
MNRFESLSEKTLREAIENGEFDDLPGRGEPIDLRENPFEDPDLRTVHRLLRNAGFAPAWIEERKDIDAELARAKTKLSESNGPMRSVPPRGSGWVQSLSHRLLSGY